MRTHFISLLVVLTAAAAGCGGGRDDRRPLGDGGASADAVVVPDGAPDSTMPDTDAGPDAGAVEGLHVAFDYRFDTRGFFADPVRRALLDAAAAEWATRLSDDFPDIPAGTDVRSRDPEQPDMPGLNFPIEDPIDDVLVFVGCAPTSGGTARSNHAAALATIRDATLQAALRERYEGPDFQPWTGWISFSCDEDWFFDPTPGTDDDIRAGAVDFLSTALHEIAHVLGFGTAGAFGALVGGAAFTGAGAVTLYGAPIPVTSDGVHIDATVRWEGSAPLMAPSRWVGTRRHPGTLEDAMLGDIGYAAR